jgi:hypothetical protein
MSKAKANPQPFPRLIPRAQVHPQPPSHFTRCDGVSIRIQREVSILGLPGFAVHRPVSIEGKVKRSGWEVSHMGAGRRMPSPTLAPCLSPETAIKYVEERLKKNGVGLKELVERIRKVEGEREQ